MAFSQEERAMPEERITIKQVAKLLGVKLKSHIERVDIIFFELNHLKKQAFATISFIPTG